MKHIIHEILGSACSVVMEKVMKPIIYYRYECTYNFLYIFAFISITTKLSLALHVLVSSI